MIYSQLTFEKTEASLMNCNCCDCVIYRTGYKAVIFVNGVKCTTANSTFDLCESCFQKEQCFTGVFTSSAPEWN